MRKDAARTRGFADFPYDFMPLDALGGLSGLYMSAFAFGGPLAQLGFACLAIGWLFVGLRTLQAIGGGAVQAHRKWVVRNVSLTLACRYLSDLFAVFDDRRHSFWADPGLSCRCVALLGAQSAGRRVGRLPDYATNHLSHSRFVVWFDWGDKRHNQR